MRESQSPDQKARINIHAEGAGVPSPETVRERAGEIAMIDGRSATAYTDEDYRQAKAELMQQPEPDDEEQIEDSLPFEPGNGEILGGQPHEARNIGADDESSIGEELVREGMDEALHDEMVEASKLGLRDAS